MKQNETPAKHRLDVLPPLTRRGLNREEAAAYIDVSPNTFDNLVREGRMPKAVKLYNPNVWEVRAIDSAFDTLLGRPASPDQEPEDDDEGGWEEVLK